MRRPKFTTSARASVPADIRVHLEFHNPFKQNEIRLFVGLHLDFSGRQALLYFGFVTLLIEVCRKHDPRPSIDKETLLHVIGKLNILRHDNNRHNNFFNIGCTIHRNKAHRHTAWFFGKLRFRLKS